MTEGGVLTQYPLATRPGFSRKYVVSAALVLAAIVAAFLLWRPPETPLGRAQELIRAGKAAAAVPVLERFLSEHPDNAAVFPLLAQGYLSCDRLGEGRTALDTALRLKLPADTIMPVILSYASYYEQKGDFEEAEKLFASAQTAIPDRAMTEGRAKLYVNWAEANTRGGDLEASVQHLEQARRLIPGLGEPLTTVVPHRLAEQYRALAAIAETKKKDDRQALELLKKSLAASDEPVTWMSMANIYSRQGKVDDAIACYRKVKDADPNNLESRHRLVDLLVQEKDYARAQEALLELTDKERSVESYQLLASLDLKLGNSAGAVRALEDARRLRPRELGLLKQLEQVLTDWSAQLSKQGRLQEAVSVKGHAAQVAEVIAMTEKKSNQESDAAANAQAPSWNPASPPIALTASRIWLAKGSLTPEGQITVKNISGMPINDLSLTVVFFDNTLHSRNGSITLPVTGPSAPPFAPGTSRALYFSCPNIVQSEDHLAVIIFWRGRLLKELPVVKQQR